MSHIVTGKLQVKSLDILKQACQRLGLEFKEGQKTFRAYSVGKCDHAISVPGANYEIGVVQTKDGYELKYDPWSSGRLENVLGEGLHKLTQTYSEVAVRNTMLKVGWQVHRNELHDGTIVLRCFKS